MTCIQKQCLSGEEVIIFICRWSRGRLLYKKGLGKTVRDCSRISKMEWKFTQQIEWERTFQAEICAKTEASNLQNHSMRCVF